MTNAEAKRLALTTFAIGLFLGMGGILLLSNLMGWYA